ncbi:MAG TPA: S8 family serine peptidase [Acidimicrobiales bacterium]|nr:S8 family serine peptidase [Acidimicrobiales bacterium]
MRKRVLGSLLALLLAAQVVGMAVAPVSPVSAAAPIITDAQGDATDFALPTGAPSDVSEPSLDIVSADIAVTADTVTQTVTVLDLTSEPPRGATGSLFRWYFTYAGMEFHTRTSRSADGSEQFRLYDPANASVPCPGCAGSFDFANETVTINVPLAVLNGSITALSPTTAPIADGADLSALEVLAQRQISAPAGGGVTPTADVASTDKKYRVGAAAPDLPPPPPALGPANADEIGDATVIAVVDYDIAPYHWDLDAAYMPQHRDTDPVNDLPLSTSPDNWLPGFPSTSSFASFAPLPLTLKTNDADADVADAAEDDAAAWASVPLSTADSVNYRWIPGTKVIGAIDFGGTKMRGDPDSHGTGVTSVSAGNLHGTCPECLIVFVNIAKPDDHDLDLPVGGPSPTALSRARFESAVRWAASQPWIDVVTNSWGTSVIGGDVRDNVDGHRGTVAPTKSATDRGQTIFFSAGNGIENGFVVPNTTYLSSQKGPDWITTVGAITPPPSDANYSGAGKPVDLSSYGDAYPSAYTATSVSGTGATGFSGTSNAAPVVAGLYARSLLAARAALPGPSRTQQGGVIASGPAGSVVCGAARIDCELGDGILTATELRTRLLLGATPTAALTSVGGIEDAPQAADERFASEGHGAYRARQSGLISGWMSDQERILGPLFGRSPVAPRPAGERDWMTVDSFCRQHLWGPWADGYYDAAVRPLPAPDPVAYPLRTALQVGCPGLVVPPTP